MATLSTDSRHQPIALRTANRVTLKLRALNSTRDLQTGKRLCSDVFLEVLELIAQIDAADLQAKYQSHFEAFQESPIAQRETDLGDRSSAKTGPADSSPANSSPANSLAWSRIYTHQCDVLRSKGVQEILIAELGTSMATWTMQSVEVDLLCQCINQLALYCTAEADRVASILIKDPSKANAMTLAVCGLALLIDTTNSLRADSTRSEPNPDSETQATVTCFAGALLCENIRVLA